MWIDSASSSIDQGVNDVTPFVTLVREASKSGGGEVRKGFFMVADGSEPLLWRDE
jgi:hypothetical protein